MIYRSAGNKRLALKILAATIKYGIYLLPVVRLYVQLDKLIKYE